MKRITILFVILWLLSACSASSPAGSTQTLPPTRTEDKPANSVPSPTYSLPSPCNLSPITVPTIPAVIPGYTELDPATGLHMTGKPIVIDLTSYRLKVSGLVDHTLEWNYEELRCLPKVTVKASLECPGFFIDQASWSGVPIATLLEKAGVKNSATRIVMVSADGYQTSITIGDALNEHNFLAYEWMGQPVPVLHGFPLRAVFPQETGYAWVKWLVEIRVE
jgi:DMSO/TMAO reductase YedYZ molybdopterin-dependent catalytic subunit